jgi:tetratricopeptide (TPR) repeat protein
MQMADGAEHGLEAVRLLHRAEDLWSESTMAGFTAFYLAGTGRLAEAARLAEETIALAERIGNKVGQFIAARAGASIALMRTGDLVAFAAYGRYDLALNTDHGLGWSNHSHAYLAVAEFLGGDPATALEHARIGADTEPPGTQAGQCLSVLVEQLGYAGARDEVLALLDTATMPVSGQANPWGSWALLRGAVEGLHVLGEHDRAGALYEVVVECIERTGVAGDPYFECKLLERVAGIAAHSARRFNDAERHYRTALAQAADLPHVPEQAHTRRFFAGMLLDRAAPDDRAEAHRIATEAVDLYRRMGMPRHLALAQALTA